MKKLVVFTLLASGLAMAHGEEALTPRTYWGDNDAPRSTSRPRTTTKETPTEETLTPQTYWGEGASRSSGSSFSFRGDGARSPLVKFSVGGSWNRYINKVAGNRLDNVGAVDADVGIRLVEAGNFRTFLNVGYSWAPEQDVLSQSYQGTVYIRGIGRVTGSATDKLKGSRNSMRLTLQPEYAFTDHIAVGLNLGIQESWYNLKERISGSGTDSSGGHYSVFGSSSENHDVFQGVAGAYLRINCTENVGIGLFCDYLYGGDIMGFDPDMFVLGANLVVMF